MQQVLQWFFKETNEKDGQWTSVVTKKGTSCGTAKSKEIVESSLCGASQRSKGFEERILLKSCFYSTINIKRPRAQGFDNMQQYWNQKLKKENIAKGMKEVGPKADSSSDHAGIKVLPITDTTIVEQCSSKHDKKVVSNGESKTKSKSRVKKLLRWAVASKSEKGGKSITGKVSRTRNQGTLKAGRDNDRARGDSRSVSDGKLKAAPPFHQPTRPCRQRLPSRTVPLH